MPATPSYPPGTPIWVDLSSPDVPASARFYGELFGWEGEDQGEESGHYTIFRKDGKMTAAVSPLQNGPPAWTTYIATADASATAARVPAAGGQVVMEPFDVMSAGRMAGFLDPSGAFVCVWEPKQHPGAELVNQPGSFCWNELTTRDIESAKAFYTKVFDWGVKSSPEYTEWTVGGQSIAGAMLMGSNFPPEVPPHWVVYFAVDDADAAVARAKELGGRASPIMDSPAGRFSIVNDPHGAVFAVIKVTHQS